jgi:hypothetical protein
MKLPMVRNMKQNAFMLSAAEQCAIAEGSLLLSRKKKTEKIQCGNTPLAYSFR